MKWKTKISQKRKNIFSLCLKIQSELGFEPPPNCSPMPPEESHSQQIETEMHSEKKSTRKIVELFKLLVQNFNSTRILKFKVNYILNVIYIIQISNTNVIYITQISGRKNTNREVVALNL